MASLDGLETGTPLFQTLLYSNTSLPLGHHTIKIANAPVNTSLNWMDLDYLIFQSPASSSNPKTVFIDDTDPSFVFADTSPSHPYDVKSSTTWSHISNSTAFNNTLSQTQSSSSSIIFSFKGAQTAAIYGQRTITGSDYSCSIDNNDASKNAYDGYWGQTASKQVLCLAQGLDENKEHMIKLTNLPSGARAWLMVDYAQLWGSRPEAIEAPSAQ